MRMSLWQSLLLINLVATCTDATPVNSHCWSSATRYTIASNDTNSTTKEWTFNEIELLEQCHLSFVQNLTRRSCPKTSLSSLRGPSIPQKYGYGFLAVFIISALSLGGFVAFPLMKKPYYKYVNAFFVALAVGTLYADTAFELFPVIIEFSVMSGHRHEHGQIESEESTTGKLPVPLLLWQMTALVLTSYIFYVMELLIHVLMHRTPPEKPCELHGHERSAYHIEVPSTATNSTVDMLSPSTHRTDTPTPKSTGWMVIIGDGIHNIADGLTIGAAFGQSLIFGVTTAIAIACHELPTELGEYMVLIESGFTFRRALLFNFISACTAIAGFFIGASVGENETARVWIFVITAGTFTYIALVDLWPTLMPMSEKFDWIRFTCVTLGYLLGVLIMFILTILEEQIVQTGSK